MIRVKRGINFNYNMTLKQEWGNFLRAIFAPQFIVHIVLTVGLYVGATFITVEWVQLAMYALATLAAGLAGAEFLKRFRKTKLPVEVRNEYSAALLDIIMKDKQHKNNNHDMVAATLKLIKKSLTK